MESIKDYVTRNALIKAAIKRLFLRFPWLGWGPVGILVERLIFYFMDEIFDLTAEWGFDVFNSNKNFRNQEAFDNEFIKLAIIEGDPTTTPQELENAIIQAENSLAGLVVHDPIYGNK